jgi:hypothetical protein
VQEVWNGSTELKMDYQQQQQGGVRSGNYVQQGSIRDLDDF